MGNRIQCIIYNASIISPLTIVLALLWCQQSNTIVVSVIGVLDIIQQIK